MGLFSDAALGFLSNSAQGLQSIGSSVSSGSGILGLLGVGRKKRQREAYKYWQKQADYSYQLQQAAADLDYQRQVQLWQMNNQYNDPSQVRSRLEKAGLLGAYAASSGAGSSYSATLARSSTPSPHIPNMDASSVFDPGSTSFSLAASRLQAAANIRQTNASADLLDEQSTTESYKRSLMDAQRSLQIALEGNTIAEQALKEFELAFRQDTRSLSVRQLRNNVNLGLASLKKIGKEIRQLSLNNSYLSSTLDDRIQTLTNEVMLQYLEMHLKGTQIALNEEEKNKIRQLIPLISAQTQTERSRNSYVQAETRATSARASVDESYFKSVKLKLSNGEIVDVPSPFHQMLESGLLNIKSLRQGVNWNTYNRILDGFNTAAHAVSAVKGLGVAPYSVNTDTSKPYSYSETEEYMPADPSKGYSKVTHRNYGKRKK